MTERISAERAREMLEAAGPAASWCTGPLGRHVQHGPGDGVPPAGIVALADNVAHSALLAAAPDLCRTVIAQAEEIAALREVVEAAREAVVYARLGPAPEIVTIDATGLRTLRSALARLDAMTEGS